MSCKLIAQHSMLNFWFCTDYVEDMAIMFCCCLCEQVCVTIWADHHGEHGLVLSAKWLLLYLCKGRICLLATSFDRLCWFLNYKWSRMLLAGWPFLAGQTTILRLKPPISMWTELNCIPADNSMSWQSPIFPTTRAVSMCPGNCLLLQPKNPAKSAQDVHIQ